MSDLWAGKITAFDFIGAADAAVNTWFQFEWHDAIAVYGLQPADMTPEEQDALAAQVNQQIAYLIPFMNAIINGSQANGGQLLPFLQRIELWVNDLGRIRQMAQNMAARDKKAEWVVGPTEQSCSTCQFYNGKVYRRSIWEKYLGPLNLLPRTKGPGKECEGWQCLCELVDTDAPVTPGRPPIWKPSGRAVGKPGRRIVSVQPA